jgi:hypothetical protein
MSEQTHIHNRRGDFRLQLLTTVSVLALANFTSIPGARADDATDRPIVWVELGGQFERLNSPEAVLAPHFFGQEPSGDLALMSLAQQPPKFSIGGEGKLSFTPDDTNWVFSAAVQYGRANSARHLHHETPGLPAENFTFGGSPFIHYTPAVRVFGDAQTTSEETHFIADFRAGKDVGLGMFGRGSTSVISAGVRFAQFTSKADVTLHARPRDHVITKYSPPPYKHMLYSIARHTYTATLHARRNTHAIGPSLSWDASVPVAGSNNGMAVAFDWGANVAVLFGRQRLKGQHQTSGRYIKGIASGGSPVSSYAPGDHPINRARTVTVPNVGGFAGLSFRYADAKLDMGYRADFFFNAIDGGIDTRKSETIGFYGPFASISVGIGG